MASSGVGAVVRRSRGYGTFGDRSSRPPVAYTPRPALPAARPRRYPEIDCIRALLPGRMIAAAERRAQAIGVGADRVLICADAITEEAYLSALAASLGTFYEPLDRTSRSDCPLSDDELIQADAAGLLPLRIRGEIVWIIAPRCATARRLADANEPRPKWLRGFRLTSSAHLRRFVARHTHGALGRYAADGLRRARPLLSNAPRAQGWRSIAAIAFVAVAMSSLALAPAEITAALGPLLCLILLAAAVLRMSSGLFTSRVPQRAAAIDDDKLPIYTIICALYQEAAVVGELVAAIRALDYPGIMAQTPQAVQRRPY